MSEGDEHHKLLGEIRDLQQKSLDTQKQLLLLSLPTFALLSIALILGLAGFFGH